MQICWSFTRQVRVDLFTGKQTLVRHMEKEKKKTGARIIPGHNTVCWLCIDWGLFKHIPQNCQNGR